VVQGTSGSKVDGIIPQCGLSERAIGQIYELSFRLRSESEAVARTFSRRGTPMQDLSDCIEVEGEARWLIDATFRG